MDLPKCEGCESFPLRVTDKHGRVYVTCPGCNARTHRTNVPALAEQQWRVMTALYAGSVK